jgi:type I restriction enzyme M protein
MNRQLTKSYIDELPNKVVTTFDLATGKLAYSGITQGRVIKSIDGDEEVVRAFVLTELVNKCGYLPERIEIEHEYTAGRPHTITSRIDIVVRDSNGDAFLFIEAKAPDEYARIDKDQVIGEQLFKLAGMERQEGHSVKYLVLYATSEVGDKVIDECIIIDNEKYQTFESWVEGDRESVNELPVRYGKAQKRQVQEMVKMFLNLSAIPKPDDVADALAVAICYAHSYQLQHRIGAMLND